MDDIALQSAGMVPAAVWGSAQGLEALWGPSMEPARSSHHCSNCLLLTSGRCLIGAQADPWPAVWDTVSPYGSVEKKYPFNREILVFA